MPIVDMPLEKLKVYGGRSPKPDDFDKFWEESLAEMEAIDPKVELIPAPIKVNNAEIFDMWFTGVGGARIHAHYARPKNGENCPAVLKFHGYSGNIGDYVGHLTHVCAGFCVAAMDCRGQGGSSEDIGGTLGNTLHGHIIRGVDNHDPKKLLFRNIFLDTALLAKIVASFDEVDENRMCASGGSQGGGLTYACAALAPHLIKMAAPCYPFLSDYKRVWEMDLAKGAYGEINEYFRHTDPTHEHEDDFFHTLGYIDIQNLAPRIKAKLLMGTGLMDTTCPPSTQFAAFNKVTSEKDVVIYPDFGHEGLPGFGDRSMAFFSELL